MFARVILLVFLMLAACRTNHVAFADEPKPDEQLRQRACMSALDEIPKLKDASFQLVWCVRLAPVISAPSERKRLVEIATIAFERLPPSTSSNFALGALPELLQMSIDRCKTAQERDLVRQRFVRSSKDPWSNACQQLFEQVETEPAKWDIIKHASSKWECSIKLADCLPFWRAQLSASDGENPTYESHHLHEFLRRFAKTHAQAMVDLVDEALTPAELLSVYDALVRSIPISGRDHEQKLQDEIVIRAAISKLPDIFSFIADKPRDVLIDSRERRSLSQLVFGLGKRKPEAALLLVDTYLVPAIQRGHIEHCMLAAAVFSDVEHIADRINKIRDVRTHYDSDHKHEVVFDNLKLYREAAQHRPDEVYQWLQAKNYTDFADRMLASGAFRATKDPLLWTKRIEALPLPEMKMGAKRGFIDRYRYEGGKVNPLSTIPKEFWLRGFGSQKEFSDFVKVSKAKNRSLQSYIAQDRLASTSNEIQEQILDSLLRAGKQETFLFYLESSTITSEQKVALLKNSPHTDPEWVVGIARVAKQHDFAWATKVLWRTLPVGRRAGVDRMRCMSLTSVGSSREACEVLGWEYGAVKSYRDNPEVVEFVEAFIDKVPAVDRPNLRQGLFEAYLDQYQYERAFDQIGQFSSVTQRLQLIQRFLTHTRRAYES